LPATWPTALHILAHALNGDLPDARHAHRRLAPDTASAGAGPLADQTAALRVLRRLWPGDMGPATAAAATPQAEETAFAALAGHAWPQGPTSAVAAALAARLRERALVEVARAYTRLPLREAALLLGYGTDEAAAAHAARQAGWRVVEAAAGGAGGAAATVVEPKPLEAAEPQLDPSSLRRLTEYLAHLEGDGFGGLLAGGGGGGAGQQQQGGVEAAAGG
jgi:hypothetical protein